MKNSKSLILLFSLVLSFFLLQCTSGDSSNESEPKVNWNNYDKNVKDRITEFTNKRNCSGLQNEFDVADQNSDNQRNRVGEGNLKLMNYIDFQMKKCNCYK